MQAYDDLLPECLMVTSFCTSTFYYHYCLCSSTKGTFVIFEHFHANNISEMITALTDVSYKNMRSLGLHTKEAAGCMKITCDKYFHWFFHHFITENTNNPLNLHN